MKITRNMIVVLFLFSFSVSPKILFAQPPEIYAGFAQIDITPPDGYTHYRGVSTGVHDPLYAKAVVWGKGDNRFALVVCDLLWIERELSTRVRLLVSQEIQIPSSNVIIAGTHSHTSPAYHLNIQELNSGLRPTSYIPPKTSTGDAYPEWLAKAIAQAIIEADKASTRVNIHTGTGTVEDLAFNRRFILTDGTVRFNAGVGNPAIVRPAGPVDTDLGIIWVTRATDNKAIGCISSFGLHADTFGGSEFSADYPGFLATALSKDFGEEFVSIFGPGACGDINHVNVKRGSKRLSTEEIGNRLAAAVKEELPKLQKLDHAVLAAESEFVYAPLQQFSEEELVWAGSASQDSLYNESAFLTRRRAVKIRSLHRMQSIGEAIPPTIGKGPWIIPLEVQVFRIGDDAAVVGLPGEIFTELSMAIKEASPFKTTLVIELTNSHIAYVPTEKAFRQGSYETINSRVAPGGGELMVEAAIKLLNEIKKNDAQ
jgi:neutral ceramidase